MNIARIKCDRFDYALPEGTHTGSNLRAFFGVEDEKHLWREEEPDDVLVPDSDEEIPVTNGARFYTAFKKINGA